MTTYISKIAKNGKTQYFRVTEDGKKKMIKREEYEANINTAPAASAPTVEADAPEITSPLDFVKSVVADVIGKYKLTFKDWTKYASVTYRSVMIIGFTFDDSKNITAVKFMGTTLETRKTVTEHKIETAADLHKVSAEIIRQIEFANYWWNIPKAESAAV
jgi:hypothetical protein